MDDAIKKYLSSKDEEILFIYGIKKSGKSEYIKSQIKGRKERLLYYSFHNTSEKENAKLLKERISLMLDLYLNTDSTEAILTELSNARERYIVVFEDVQHLIKFTSLEIVNTLRKLTRIHRLIISSSDEETYENLDKFDFIYSIEKKSAKYYESFEPLRNLQPIKQLQFYLTFGSSDFVIKKIDPEESLKRNVRALLIEKESLIREYIEHELFEDLGKKSYAFLILSILKDDRMKYGDLVEKTGQKYNGLLDKQLNILSSLGLVKKSYPINKKVDRKKVLYEISDNLLRFYFRFIYPHSDLVEIIGSKAFYERFIEKDLDNYFKKSLRTVLYDYLEKLSLDGKTGSISLIGRYYISDDQEEEIALITENSHRIYSLFYGMRVDDEMLLKEKKRIKEITGGKAEAGLLSTNGFTFQSDGFTYISLKDIFSLKG